MLAQIPLIHVKKESGHGTQIVASSCSKVSTYLIIDDFVCTGSTIRTIMDSIYIENRDLVCVGTYLYLEEHPELARKELENRNKKYPIFARYHLPKS